MVRLLIAIMSLLLTMSRPASAVPHRPVQSAAVLPIETPANLQVSSYDLSVRISPESHRLEGSGTIELQRRKVTGAVLEFELREEFTLREVREVSGRSRSAPATLTRSKRGDQFIWTARFETPPTPGRTVRFNVVFDGAPPDPGRYLYIGPEVSFANSSRESWIPKLVGYPVQGRISFSVPPGIVVASGGERSSTAEQQRAGLYVFETTVPSDPWFAAGRYTVTESPGPVPTAVYLLRPRASVGTYAEGCARIIEVLGRQFGGIPFGSFSLVELPPEIAQRAGGFNALGSPGGILTQGGAFDQPFNLAYFSHEVGHQWWGNVVTRDPADARGDYMMDEAMADLASLIAVEAIEGPQIAEQYRRTGYPGFNAETYSALGYLKLAAAGLDLPLSQLPDGDLSFRLARSKGGRIWYALREEIGRERFSEVARAVVREHAFRPVTWTRFLKSISRAAGRDLRWFYAENFDRTGAPSWTLRSTPLGSEQLELLVEQPVPAYRGRVPVTVAVEGGRTLVHNVQIRGSRSRAVVNGARSARALLDPSYSRLRWTPEYRAEAVALAGYTRGRLAEGAAARLAIWSQALKELREPDPFAAGYQLHVAMGAILASERRWAEARVHLEAGLARPTRVPDRVPLTYLRLANVARELGDAALMNRAAEMAISTDAAVGNRSGAAAQARALLEGR